MKYSLSRAKDVYIDNLVYINSCLQMENTFIREAL